ncbi:MAG: peptidyl-tRNA hydrolase [Anaerolineaceae bacterium]|nr:peptidyl-tRNA hydrolase [Anaerolineaceae bacterium]
MKQAIVVNQELKLPKGKLAAQVAHAAVAAFLEAASDIQEAWLEEGMPKVVLASQSAADLRRLELLAEENGIAHCLIEDAGRTVVPAGTITCIGLGPAPDDQIDRLTGELKLL